MGIDYNTKLIGIRKDWTGEEFRKLIVANALSVVGVSASNKQILPIFETLLGPLNGKWDLSRPFKTWQENGKWKTQGVSTCGLVCRGLMRRVKVDMPEIYKNYVFGTVITAEIRFADGVKPYGAWQTPSENLLPQAGDIIVIGTGISTHMLTVIGWDNNKVISVDGGRVDKNGLQCIEKVEREWVVKNNKPYLKDSRSSRVVVGWIMASLLPYRKDVDAEVPEGWEGVII